MRKIISELLNIFTPKEKRQFLYMVLPLMSLTMLFEIVGVMAIMPFMSLVLSPESATEGRKGWLFHYLNFDSVVTFTIYFGLAVVLILIIRGLVSTFAMWFMLRFAHSERISLTDRLLTTYLSQPYHFFMTNNSSRLTKLLTVETIQITNSVIVEGAQCFSALITILTMVALFLIIMPYIAISAMTSIGAIFALVFMLSKTRLNKASEVIESYESDIYQTMQECFGGIKDIKLRHREKKFIDTVHHLTRALSINRAYADIVGIIPKYTIEMLGYSSIILIILTMLALGSIGETIIPKLAMFAFAGIKLMPALQQVFRSVANIYAREQSINALTEHLYQQPRVTTSVNEQGDNQQLTFSNQIELIDVSYRYPNCQQTSLANIHLTVPEQSSLGIVGPTGSGKSTLINLMLGLIEPETGTIYIDNTVLNQDNIEAWQNNIGYVPQDIYLADRTIKENIAFEIDDNDIDEHAVHRAACSAHIHDFIQNELPKGYDTIVGERGIRLSGGQKQRLGIARALYYDPQVLVLDEATSALDPNTEKLVLDTIYTAAQNRTVILVTHRLASIHNCDKIIFMEQGQIKSAGTYNDLLNANETFSQMSQANNA